MGKTAQELYNDYKNAKRKMDGIDKKISERLLFLAKTYPDATMVVIHGIEIKSKTLTEYPDLVETYSVRKRINLINYIETWLKNQNPYVQLELF